MKTSDGQPITILSPGVMNTHSGPDFSNAKIRIGTLAWVGTIEMHTKASGWYEHNHEDNPAYENVILHVVWENNRDVYRRDGSLLPVLELCKRVDKSLIDNYRFLIENSLSIPCKKLLPQTPHLIKLSMIHKAAVQRLEAKASRVHEWLKKSNNDWEQATYRLIARNFGFGINGDVFFRLACATPLNILLKQGDELARVEAMLFGQAGLLLSNFTDPYPSALSREYNVLSTKYRLEQQQLNGVEWKFSRMRPANSPTLRIAQFAALMVKQKTLFAQIVESETLDQLRHLFYATPSPYWHTHYRFDSSTDRTHFCLGKHSVDSLIINTVGPLLTAYAQAQDQPDLIDRAVHILEQLAPEKNAIVKKWDSSGVDINSALVSQGIIELYHNFCLKKKCLSCSIGFSVLNPAS